MVLRQTLSTIHTRSVDDTPVTPERLVPDGRAKLLNVLVQRDSRNAADNRTNKGRGEANWLHTRRSPVGLLLQCTIVGSQESSLEFVLLVHDEKISRKIFLDVKLKTMRITLFYAASSVCCLIWFVLTIVFAGLFGWAHTSKQEGLTLLPPSSPSLPAAWPQMIVENASTSTSLLGESPLPPGYEPKQTQAVISETCGGDACEYTTFAEFENEDAQKSCLEQKNVCLAGGNTNGSGAKYALEVCNRKVLKTEPMMTWGGWSGDGGCSLLGNKQYCTCSPGLSAAFIYYAVQNKTAQTKVVGDSQYFKYSDRLMIPACVQNGCLPGAGEFWRDLSMYTNGCTATKFVALTKLSTDIPFSVYIWNSDRFNGYLRINANEDVCVSNDHTSGYAYVPASPVSIGYPQA